MTIEWQHHRKLKFAEVCEKNGCKQYSMEVLVRHAEVGEREYRLALLCYAQIVGSIFV